MTITNVKNTINYKFLSRYTLANHTLSNGFSYRGSENTLITKQFLFLQVRIPLEMSKEGPTQVETRIP